MQHVKNNPLTPDMEVPSGPVLVLRRDEVVVGWVLVRGPEVGHRSRRDPEVPICARQDGGEHPALAVFHRFRWLPQVLLEDLAAACPRGGFFPVGIVTGPPTFQHPYTAAVSGLPSGPQHHGEMSGDLGHTATFSRRKVVQKLKHNLSDGGVELMEAPLHVIDAFLAVSGHVAPEQEPLLS